MYPRDYVLIWKCFCAFWVGFTVGVFAIGGFA